ncbi:MAG TPA: GNAT family N-acetyltransferase [Candidatus Acutalibacter ornithocaccae]|uniref:GNAT family N-acetyltransferase n=1 Tax=Candidatus Acutalibacter ornithocaccae TaxID=2838416 RepID=A0A9D2M029_9FIRM|nr:GNAT family N-acetyltransferase [Candidatus Acutalibacter ornithocaccae]
MRLIPLWEADEERAYDLQKSFAPNENGFVNGAYGLSRQAFSEFVQLRKRNSQGLDLPEGHVPDTVYVLEDDSEGYVGIVKLRHRLNDALRQGAGHIGYGIRKEYRGRGYATAALSLALDEARKIVPEDEIYLSVRKDNPASLKVQLCNGARVDHESGEEYFTRIPLSRQP